MASAANVAWLQQTGRRYLIGTPKSDCALGRELAAATDWQRVREAWRSSGARDPTGRDLRAVPLRRAAEKKRRCTTASRSGSRRAGHARRAHRPRPQTLDRGKLDDRSGGVLERNTRAASRYTMELVEDPTRRRASPAVVNPAE